jgi:hypothetical protein
MFNLERVTEKSFGSFDETLAFVSEEKKRLARIPIAGLWKAGARFHEDGRIGKGSQSYKFNDYGFQAICDLTGVPVAALRQLQTPELASKVLNDLIDGLLNADRTANRSEIILDESTGVVIGVVSQKYVGYSNDAFLKDVLICLDEDNDGALFPTTSDFVSAGLYFGFHLIEGETLTPMLLAKRFTLNPVLVIISLVFWFWMWGIPGGILSMPMLAITKIICDRLQPLAAFGHFLEG